MTYKFQYCRETSSFWALTCAPPPFPRRLHYHRGARKSSTCFLCGDLVEPVLWQIRLTALSF